MARQCGFASTSANVVHVPHAKCPEVELAIEALEEKMPIDVVREPGTTAWAESKPRPRGVCVGVCPLSRGPLLTDVGCRPRLS